MKITLGRIILIMTLICIFLGISHALKIEWEYALAPFIAEYKWITSGVSIEPPELKTLGQFVPLFIGVLVSFGLTTVLIIVVPIGIIGYLWEITQYKGK